MVKNMTELLIWVIIWTIPASIITYVAVTLAISTYYDRKHPPEPIKYVWTTILAFDSRDNTKVYYDEKTHWIRGKVVHQTDGLYRATMWNGAEEDFLFLHEAIKQVEEYKPRVHK